MKKNLLSMFTLFLMSIGVANAQVEVNENYVQSEQGFVCKEGSLKIGKEKYYYSGIYTADGKTCVKLNYNIQANRDKTANVVAPGTEVLASNAISHIIGDLILPKSLKKIYTNSLGVRNVIIYDDNAITEHIVIK